MIDYGHEKEESPLPIRATQEEIYPKAVLEDHVDHYFSNHGRRTGLDLKQRLAIYEGTGGEGGGRHRLRLL